jgi:translation elongation factor EF-Tu-like GTPase
MKVIGKFSVKDSFTIKGRGLVVIGDIIEGKIKIGAMVSFNTSLGNIVLAIGGFKVGYHQLTGEEFVGLVFMYKDKRERRKYQSLKLPEQIVEVKLEE